VYQKQPRNKHINKYIMIRSLLVSVRG
jgi:hypothetical protein